MFLYYLLHFDKIAAYMYTPIGDEPEYYYKVDSDEMGAVLSIFHTHKYTILSVFLKNYG